MSPAQSLRTLARALLVPGLTIVALPLAGASPVEAASSTPSQASPSQPNAPAAAAQPATPAAAAAQPTPLPCPPGIGPSASEAMDPARRTTAAEQLGRRIAMGTRESARLKQANAAPQAGAATNQLLYRGCQVQNTPQVYLSLWGSDWKGTGYQPAIRYVQGFFGNVGGSGWLGVTTQYCSGAVSSPTATCSPSMKPITNPVGQLKGTWVDTRPVSFNTPPSACGVGGPGDGVCDVMQAAQRAADHFKPLPKGAVVMVLTPSSRSPSAFGRAWCAYHSATLNTGVAFGYIPYMPDAGASCGRNSVNPGGTFDGFSIVGGHEYSEAITDPFPGYGWIDSSSSENADKCAWGNHLTNITLGGNAYAIQQTWSNAAGGCQTSGPSSQSPSPSSQQAPQAAFSRAGGSLTSAPGSTSWGTGRLDVVARGSGNALVACPFAGNGCPWATVGGVLTSEPAVVAWSPNRLDVFARGTDNALWHTFGDGSRWFGWESLGGVLKTGPTVSSWDPGRLDVFVAGTDNAVWHRFYANGWSGWESLGGNSVSSPAAVSTSSGVVDIFTQGPDNTLRHRAFNGSVWTGWENLGGTLSWSPSVAGTGINQMAVFVRGGDSLLYRTNWNGGAWSGFQKVGTNTWPSVASATSQPDSMTVDLFTRGASDNALYHAKVT
jgi:hypothetical protein